MLPQISYLQFHIVFILPATLALAASSMVIRPEGNSVRSNDRGHIYWLVVVALMIVALLYTTPWDNYLIARGVWEYGEGRVLRTVGHAPIEEYLFILVQPLMTAFWLAQLPLREGWPNVSQRLRPVSRLIGCTTGVLVGCIGLYCLQGLDTFYLGAILLWAAPVLTLQWTVGPCQLLYHYRGVLFGTFVPTIYLWGADRVAIAVGIWTLADKYTTGITLAGLPIEEAIFFFVTNLFVVQGLILYRWVITRWA